MQANFKLHHTRNLTEECFWHRRRPRFGDRPGVAASRAALRVDISGSPTEATVARLSRPRTRKVHIELLWSPARVSLASRLEGDHYDRIEVLMVDNSLIAGDEIPPNSGVIEVHV